MILLKRKEKKRKKEMRKYVYVCVTHFIFTSSRRLCRDVWRERGVDTIRFALPIKLLCDWVRCSSLLVSPLHSSEGSPGLMDNTLSSSLRGKKGEGEAGGREREGCVHVCMYVLIGYA